MNMKYIEINARELLWNKEALEFYDYLEEKVQDHPAGKKYLERYFKNKILNNELELPLAKESDYAKAPSKSKNEYAKKALDKNELYLVKFDDNHKRLFIEFFDYIRTLDKNKPINIPFKEIPKVVKEYHERFTKLKEEQEDLAGIKPIYEFKDGYKWVSIESQQGLKRESSLMQHCVGEDPQYWNKVKDKKILILSLRDKQNKPHITIEYNLKTKKIHQIQGKQDEPPIQKYISPYLEFLLLNTNSPLKHKEKFKNNEIYYGMQYQDKHFYSPFNLPENFTWYNNLNLSGTQIKELPEGLEVRGSLNLYMSQITKLPEGLKVGGSLDLYMSQITKLPKDLKVGGYLDLYFTPIKELPEGLDVGGNLSLYRSQITKLPEGLKVGGNLNLSDTQIKELPKDLTIVDNLYLSNTQITKLPKGLKVGGYLDLSNTQIEELPKDLKVGGSLDLSHTQITRLPKGLKVSGDLYLSDTLIKELPKGLQVDSNLDLSNTLIKELPKGLKVGGKIYGFKG